MAVKAADSVTLAAVTDVDYMRRYYLLQSSTLSTPAVPTTNPPTGSWTTIEPGYTGGATNSLYTTDLVVFSDGTFDYLPVQKSSSYEAAKQAWNLANDTLYVAQAVNDQAISRGTDLVTNGTGLLGTNYNFTGFTFDPTDAPVGANGSFRTSAYMDTKFTSEFIPVDPSKKYILTMKARQRVAGKASRAYAGLAPYDAQGRSITPQMYVHDRRTEATLTTALNPGDTTMKVSALTASYWTHTPAYKYVGVWNWDDGTGRVWPLGTYTRNFPDFTSVDEATKTITLSAPYAGPAMPVGTPITRNFPGGNYMYTGPANDIIPETWTTYRSVPIGGLYDGNRQTTANAATEFPPGCAKVKILFLSNRDVTGGEHAWASISFSDATAAQDAADSAKAIALGKTANTNSLSPPNLAPGGATGTTAGDTWTHYEVIGSVQYVKKMYVSDGATWTEAQSYVVADQITGGALNASIGIWSGGQIIAGDWFGACAVMSVEGFLTKQLDEDGFQFTATNMGNPNGKNTLAIYNAPNQPATFEVSTDGDINAQTLDITADPTFRGRPLIGANLTPAALSDAWMNDLPQGPVGFGNVRSLISGASWVGGAGTYFPLAVVSFVMHPGRMYRVTMPTRFDMTAVTTGARAGVAIKYTYAALGTEPAEPTTSSTNVEDALFPSNVNVAAVKKNLVFNWPSPFGAPHNIKMLVCGWANGCTVNTSNWNAFDWQIMVEDVGPIPESTARLLSQTTTTPAVRTYTTTWAATASASYRGDGSKNTGDATKKILRHGWVDSALGDNRSAFAFTGNSIAGETGKTISAAITGATVAKVEVWINSLHWYYSNGGTATIRPLNSSSIPPNLPTANVSGSAISSKFTTRNQGKWITIPTSWVTASNTGVVLGPTSSTNNANYGYFAAHDHATASAQPRLRITYTR